MSTEIERKFLVDPDKLPNPSEWDHCYRIEQWYLVNTSELTVRVRIYDGAESFVTIKGKRVGIACPEYEFVNDYEDVDQLYKMVELFPCIKKTRREIAYGGYLWEVDFFDDGLILAEVELGDDKDGLVLPPWVTEEVSEDPKYFNCNMVKT